jgi:hypothetical protein
MTTDDLRWFFLQHIDAQTRQQQTQPSERRALLALREILTEDEEFLGRVQARYHLSQTGRAE